MQVLVAQAAETVYSASSLTVNANASTGAIDTTGYTDLILSFDYDGQGDGDSADGIDSGDTFRYGWKIGPTGTENELGSVPGANSADATELGSVTDLALPAGAAGVTDLEIYFKVESAGGGTDTVSVTNILLEGDQVVESSPVSEDDNQELECTLNPTFKSETSSGAIVFNWNFTVTGDTSDVVVGKVYYDGNFDRNINPLVITPTADFGITEDKQPVTEIRVDIVGQDDTVLTSCDAPLQEAEDEPKSDQSKTGDLRVCKIIVAEDGEIISGADLDTGFSVDITGPGDFDETVTFSTALDLDTDLLTENGEVEDAECVVFEGVAQGDYYYDAEEIAGEGEWLTPLYHDFFSEAADMMSDFGDLAPVGTDGKKDHDGHIVLKNKPRTLAILNQLEPKPPVCEIGENLLENGSFEEPEVTDDKNWFYTPIVDWVITALSDGEEQDGELHRGWEGNQAADGEQYAELDSRESVKMSQTVDTVDGATYELKWAFAPRHNTDADENQLSVLVDGSEVATEGPASLPAGLTPGDWTRSSYTFAADSDETTISFADAGVTSDEFGTFLDDAALCFVREPEPEPEEPDVCSYEGEVISTDQGLTNGGVAVDIDRSDSSNVADGVASYNNWGSKEPSWSTDDFYSLGINGTLVYEFTDKIAVDQAGDDIAIWEITGGTSGQSNESADVYLSENGIDFELAGTVTGDGTVDIADTTISFVKFVKLVDQSNGVQGDNGDGFDVDAITIIDGSCDDYVTVSTTKIICDLEEELPNWGDGSDLITENTAAEWLAENDDTSCRIADGWEFEWAPNQGTNNPGNDLIGAAGGNWTTFTGSVDVPLSEVDNKSFWMREVLQEGYILFGGSNETADESAEMYCHKDVLNYDNYDRVDNPKAGEEYHCIAWNVPAEPEQCELDIYSDTMTLVDDTNELARETYNSNARWTADIPGATWVWATEQVENPESNETYTFVETFEVANPTFAEVVVAYDNWLRLTVNGTPIDDRETNGYQDFQKQTYDILSALVPGENRIEFEVKNLGQNGSNYRSNPAGVLFHLSVLGDADTCERTTGPKEKMYLIDGKKYEGEFERPNVDILRFDTSIQISNSVVSDWTIELYDGDGNYITSTTTDENGHYYFWVSEGEYEVREVVKPGWIQVGVDDGGDYEYTNDELNSCLLELPRDEQQENSIAVFRGGEEYNYSQYRCDFYNVRTDDPEDPTGVITGVKWNDVDGDGVQDEGEQLLSGWTIVVSNANNDDELSATTDTDGTYSIEVPAGTWVVSEVQEPGWTQTGTEYFDDPSTDLTCEFVVGSEQQARLAVDESYLPEYRCDFGNEQNQTITTTRSSGGSGETGTRIRRAATPERIVLGEATSFCPFLTDHMQMGWENDAMEVMKLQLFLNIFRDVFGGTENPVTGMFGPTTDENVKRFQAAYRDEVLTPWYERGIVPHNEPTGFVYKTTLWKINSIVCPAYAIEPDFTGENLLENVDLD